MIILSMDCVFSELFFKKDERKRKMRNFAL